MNTKPWMILAVGLGLVARFAVAAAAPKPVQDQPQAAPAAEKQDAYLGLMSAPIPEALRHQMDLQTDAGVMVAQVDPEGAVGGTLAPFDLLLKLDDQWIWNQEQLQGLVRMHKPGDKVALTFVRKSDRQTADVTLKGRALAPADVIRQRAHLPHAGVEPIPMPLPQPFPGQQMPMRITTGGSGQAQTEAHVSFFMNDQDDQGSYALRMRDGAQTFSVKDPDGNLVFEGPVNTDEERAKVPADLQPKLRELQDRMPQTQIRQFTVPGGSVMQLQSGVPGTVTVPGGPMVPVQPGAHGSITVHGGPMIQIQPGAPLPVPMPGGPVIRSQPGARAPVPAPVAEPDEVQEDTAAPM